MSTEIEHLEFELEKARSGLAMPYDRRVWQLETQLREARQKLRMPKAKTDGRQALAEVKQVAGRLSIVLEQGRKRQAVAGFKARSRRRLLGTASEHTAPVKTLNSRTHQP